jgi:hypothetical protein
VADGRGARSGVIAGRVAAALGAVALLAGCSVGSGPAEPEPAVSPPPPAPPAACVLDTAALGAATGLTWTPDETTASDTRCVYDPAGAPSTPDGPAFVAVDIAPAGGPDAASTLDTVAGLCDPNSRADVTAADGGFVCRFQGGSVFAAAVRNEQVVTVAASAVPPGTTAARIVTAFNEQLRALR